VAYRRPRGGEGSGRPPDRSFDAPRLPEGYLVEGYFLRGNDGTAARLRDELIIDHARRIAGDFARIGLTGGQLRRFYDHARKAGRQMESRSFTEALPSLLEMKPLAADAVGRARAEGKDYELFKQFIDRNVDCARESRKAFEEGFLKHFMYVLAYFKYLKPKG
jgi:CRISPR type III-A-associated protein Csm2